MRDMSRGKRVPYRLRARLQIEELILENESLKEKVKEANALLSKYLPRRCWTCALSREDCYSACYTDESWNCLSWIYKPL